MQNKVINLFTGYCSEESSNSMRANCSCTLIQTSTGSNVIVDTMTAWDGDSLQAALQSHGLAPKDITAVVCTHGHSDHIGCNYLFQEAKWHFVGSSCVSHRDKYFIWSEADEIFQLDEDVAVHRTPGHTLSCVSVIVKNSQHGVVGVCGDLFERAEDINEEALWLDAGSENPSEQRQQRLRMAETCAFIIPGHGPGFVVSAEMRLKLRKDMDTYLEKPDS